MKQVIQNYSTGDLELAEVPVPNCSSNAILVKNEASLISIGTERSIIDLGKKSLLGKAKARPDLVKRFLDKAKKEGFIKTFNEALGRLDNPTPLGYSSAGTVVEAGKNINKFSPGDKVACIGAGYASHAEFISIPENLCCKIPDNVSFEEASFGMLGIIALHGIRCANLNFGEKVAVLGLGLLGLLTVQILKSYGCDVTGYDIDPTKVNLAKKMQVSGAFADLNELKNYADKSSGGYGMDAVIITASTKSDEPVNAAVEISRMKGRIVMVGVGDIHPDRNEMWHKEVDIIVSKAGGAGIFDPFYENKGIDYPLGYIRWTENRNLEEFLRLISDGKVNVKPLISEQSDILNAEKIYEDILKNSNKYIGVVLKYPEKNKVDENDRLKIINVRTTKDSNVRLGVIGAGLFGKALLLPTLKNLKDVDFYALSTSSSANVYHTGKKYGFKIITTDYREVLNNQDINSIVILTPHSQHKKMVIESLNAKKHIFIEKPLCISEEELDEIYKVYSEISEKENTVPILMVGYNRRFSSHSKFALDSVSGRKDPLLINYRVNAGFVPSDHWVHSEEEGGNRIVGEMCHFVDLLQFLTNSKPAKIYAERVSGNNKSIVNSDNVNIVIKFKDGSIGNIFYTASGDKAFSREQVEIFCEGKTIKMTDFKETSFWFNGKKKKFKTLNQEMGYKEELENFTQAILGKNKMSVTPEDIFLSTLAIFKIEESLQKGIPVYL